MALHCDTAVAHFMLGPKRDDASDRLGSLTSEAWRGVINDHLGPEKRFVTLLLPAGATEWRIGLSAGVWIFFITTL